MKKIILSFFCYATNGGPKEFSTKKFFAFIFAFFLGVVSHLWLMFAPGTHWIVSLKEAGINSASLAIIMGVIDALILGSLTVYGWSKSKNV